MKTKLSLKKQALALTPRKRNDRWPKYSRETAELVAGWLNGEYQISPVMRVLGFKNRTGLTPYVFLAHTAREMVLRGDLVPRLGKDK